MLPVTSVGLVGLLLVARRVDALALGDDAARGLGVPVHATRVTVVVLAALLSAAAVPLAGPIGFVGLCAPALVRPLARRFRSFTRARAVLPVAGLAGAGLVLGSDVLLRALIPADTAVAVPTGIVTSPVGAVFLVVTALRLRDTAGADAPDRLRISSRRAFLVTVAALVAAVVGVALAGILLGDSKLLLGDVANWVHGRAGQTVSFVLDTRGPGGRRGRGADVGGAHRRAARAGADRGGGPPRRQGHRGGHVGREPGARGAAGLDSAQVAAPVERAGAVRAGDRVMKSRRLASCSG